MQEELILTDLLFVFRKRWKWLVLSVVLGALAAFLFSTFVLDEKYTASVDLYVNNNQNESGNVNINDINASQKLVNTYIVILNNHEVLQRISDTVGTVTVPELRKLLTLSSVSETEVLRISATTEDPALSARICNVMAEVAPAVIERVIRAGSVEVIGSATVPTEPSSPNVKLNTVLGALLFLAATCAVCLIVYFFDTTVKGEDDVKQKTGLPVLGEIPSFGMKTN